MPNQKRAGGAKINLLQFTDCHLMKSADGELLGVNTRESLSVVTALAKSNIESGIHENPDLILATGDLAQDGSPEAYRHFKEHIDEFSCPVSWFPGNHDDLSAMKKAVGSGGELAKVVRVGDWQFILLNSLVPGSVHGFLEQEELDTLERTLEENPDVHTMVCFHHHPIDIDSVWLDKIGLRNRDDLFEIVNRYTNVRALLWGHIHQELDDEIDDFIIMATPSTCVQFLPESDDFAVDPIAPGYRWFTLHADGTIDTGVIRALDYEFELDLASNGY